MKLSYATGAIAIAATSAFAAIQPWTAPRPAYQPMSGNVKIARPVLPIRWFAATPKPAPTPTPTPTPAPVDDTKLLFCDEFDTLNLRSAKGIWDTSYYWQGTENGSTLPGEQEWYLDSDYKPTQSVKTVEAKDGVLTFTAMKTPDSIAAFTNDHDYVSGMITSGRTYAQKFGYFEMRAKTPAGGGLWPAFWLVPGDMTASHEIDVMEAVGQETKKLHTSFHEHLGVRKSQTKVSDVSDMSTNYHLYGVDWQTDTITWYFDRQAVYQVKTPAELQKPMFMIANLAMGGGMPGPIAADTKLPAQMNIDYIRVYAKLPKTAAGALPLPGRGVCTM